MTSSEDLLIREGETLEFEGQGSIDQDKPEEEEEARLLGEVRTNPSKFLIRECMNDIVILRRNTKVGRKGNLNHPSIFCDIFKVLTPESSKSQMF